MSRSANAYGNDGNFFPYLRIADPSRAGDFRFLFGLGLLSRAGKA